MAIDRVMRHFAVMLAASAVASAALAGIKPPPAQVAQAEATQPAKVSPYAKANRERAKAPKAAHKGPAPLSARWTPAGTNRGGRH